MPKARRPLARGRVTPAAPARKPRPLPRGKAEPLAKRERALAPEASVEELLREPIRGPVRILFLDVDGTMTDGRITFGIDGDSRNFWVRDGLALEWARELGVLPVVISGRDSKAVEARMRDLSLEYYLGAKDKVGIAERVLAREQATWQQCVMVGDDLPDVPMLKRVGWPIAVNDAVPEVRAIARTITGARAGFGAVREVVEMVLRHNGVWEQVLRRYEAL